MMGVSQQQQQQQQRNKKENIEVFKGARQSLRTQTPGSNSGG